MTGKKITIPGLAEMKARGEKITMVTAYDYPTALLVERAGIELILVGDSVGMTVLGYKDTVPVTMEEMLHHTRAVSRAVGNCLVVADMPFLSYQVSTEQAVINSGRLIKEGGAQAVKVEGGAPIVPAVKAMVAAGIPVMGHLGLTPQSASQLGGYRVQGRTPEAARRILDDAQSLAAAGAFSLVLECVPAELAAEVTETVAIPTIGIGAGPKCDGQVLVFHDLVGLFERFTPKFVKPYADLKTDIVRALTDYREEVKQGSFPGQEHCF